MKKVNNKIKYIFILFLALAWNFANGQHLFSEVTLNKTEVYPGEPVEVSVSVYTSTWFTKGVDPGNVKVEDAFTVYFRGVSISKQIKGKNYAGVKMIFNVFPYENHDIVFPSLEVSVETPPDGGYIGVARTIKTKAKSIRVKPIPKGFNDSQWLVSTGVTVNDVWSGSVKKVNVGDVLMREITRKAEGTVSGLIPPLAWDSITGVSKYLSASSVENNRTKTSISAQRTDGVHYLFEKEGEIIIPEMVISWWNPNVKKRYKRTLKKIVVNVEPNPDLGMLETVRDSLDALNAAGSKEEGKEKNFFQRLTKKQITLLAILTFVVIYLLKKIVKIYLIIKWLVAFFKKKWQTYYQSEKDYFHQFVKAAKTKDNAQNLNAAYRWIDKLNLAEPTLTYFAKQSAIEIVIKEAALLIATTDNPGKKVPVTIRQWALARKRFLNQSFGRNCDAQKEWINPPHNCL